MLPRYVRDPDRIRALRNGLAGAMIDDFRKYLLQSGYAQTSVSLHIGSAELFAYWASGTGVIVSELDDEALARFDRQLTRWRYARSTRANILRGARLFLRHSHGVEAPAIQEPQPSEPLPPLLVSFCEWMRAHRGTSQQTLYNYSIPLRQLICRLGDDPSQLDARQLRDFVLDYSRTTGWAAAKRCTTALRMFLRFLSAEGRCRASLVDAVPVVAHWRLSSLPRYLPPADVERLIDACDRSSPVGQRDRAILLLLARLGLRAGDIVQLRLDDIDWKGAWIQVSGKSRRQTRLPLTQEVGEAIAAYVQDSRPQADTPALFVRSRAPLRAFASHAAVSVLVTSAMHRAGIQPPARGAAHLLRHSVASAMLRQGASLQQVSALLRHRCIETTQIYAKVDVTALMQIAQPWPEPLPC